MLKPFLSFHPIFQVLVLWLAGLGAAVQFAKIGVMFTYVRAIYPDAGAEIGLLLSLISVFGSLFGMTAGIFVARIGFRRMLIFALALGAAMSFWQAVGLSFWVLLASRVIEGLSHLIIVVAAPTMIAQISAPRFRGMAMTLWSTFFGVGYALAALYGLPFVAVYGLERLFFVHGIFMIGLAVVLFFALDTLDTLRKPGNAAQSKLGFGAVIEQHIAAYRSPYIAAPAVGWLFYTFAFVSLLSILPEMLPAQNRAAITALMPIGSIAVALVVVAVLLRFIEATHIVVLGFILSLGMLGGFWGGMPIAVVAVGLFATLGLVQGASFAAVPRLNKTATDQALANGALAQLGNLGNMLGTPVLLLVIAGFGREGMIVVVGLCFAAGAGAHVWFGLRRMRR